MCLHQCSSYCDVCVYWLIDGWTLLDLTIQWLGPLLADQWNNPITVYYIRKHPSQMWLYMYVTPITSSLYIKLTQIGQKYSQCFQFSCHLHTLTQLHETASIKVFLGDRCPSYWITTTNDPIGITMKVFNPVIHYPYSK